MKDINAVYGITSDLPNVFIYQSIQLWDHVIQTNKQQNTVEIILVYICTFYCIEKKL